jgi:hypothetical protein
MSLRGLSGVGTGRDSTVNRSNEMNDAELAKAIYDWFREYDRRALVQGSPDNGTTLIDGHFDLKQLAAVVLAAPSLRSPPLAE